MLNVRSLLLISVLFAAPICAADEHGESWSHHDGRPGRRGGGGFGRGLRRGCDKGNEITGQIVAWGLAAANLTVALSLLTRAAGKLSSLGPGARVALSRFNGVQKKYLMKLHYVLNPLVLTLAFLHWTLSRCRSTVLPEWGLLAMAFLVALGILLKFRLFPTAVQRSVHRLHTQPALFLIAVTMLVIGHLSMAH